MGGLAAETGRSAGPESAKRTAQNKDALVAVALKSCYSREDAIVHGVHDVLFASEIFFRGLNRGVSEQKLDLFEIPAGLPAQFRSRPSQVVGARCSMQMSLFLMRFFLTFGASRACVFG
jgi:hypothetical protein